MGRGVALAALVAAVGCGGSATTNLTGTVTIGGAALPDDAIASVTFGFDDRSVSPIKAPITGGQYEASRVPIGPCKAYFDIAKPTGPPVTSQRTGEPYQPTQSIVPLESANVAFEVTADQTTKDFDL